MSFHVRAADDRLVFSAAHFITLADGTCEPLHGHNWRVTADVYGPLDERQWVVDFHVLRAAIQAIIGELDHRVLLPTGHPAIGVSASQQEVEARFAQRRWVFPRAECVLLPLAATTSELLAQYIAQRLAEELRRRTGRPAAKVRVSVEESFGLWAVYELENPETGGKG